MFKKLCFTVFLTIAGYLVNAQLMVDNTDVSQDPDIQYIQLLYYIDKNSYKPVYFIDIGTVEPDLAVGSHQRITIDSVGINSNMTPVHVLNKLYKAGWVYLGDANYIPLPLRNDWHVLTLKRREEDDKHKGGL